MCLQDLRSLLGDTVGLSQDMVDLGMIRSRTLGAPWLSDGSSRLSRIHRLYINIHQWELHVIIERRVAWPTMSVFIQIPSRAFFQACTRGWWVAFGQRWVPETSPRSPTAPRRHGATHPINRLSTNRLHIIPDTSISSYKHSSIVQISPCFSDICS